MGSGTVLKEIVHDLAVCLWSYGCTWEAGEAVGFASCHSNACIHNSIDAHLSIGTLINPIVCFISIVSG